MSNAISRLKEQLWPGIRDRESARKSAIRGFAAAFAHFAGALAFAAWTFFKTPFFGVNAAKFLIVAAIFGAVALGFWRLSRVAAVAGLTFFFLDPIWWLQYDRSAAYTVRTFALTIVLGLMFVHGIRGTFAYHKFMIAEPSGDAPRLNRSEASDFPPFDGPTAPRDTP
jgi:hypothetical protein